MQPKHNCEFELIKLRNGNQINEKRKRYPTFPVSFLLGWGQLITRKILLKK